MKIWGGGGASAPHLAYTISMSSLLCLLHQWTIPLQEKNFSVEEFSGGEEEGPGNDL